MRKSEIEALKKVDCRLYFRASSCCT